MVLAIDIGNTNVVLGGWEGDSLRFVARLETDRSKTQDGYAIELSCLLELYGVARAAIDGSIISSVVPQITKPMAQAVRRLTGRQPLIVGPGIKTGLNIRIDDPAQLGSDLVANSVGALSKYPRPIIIVDMGTATTVCVIDENANYLGGSILTGLRTSLDALVEHTAQLQQVELEPPPSVIGTNTVDSMKSGAIFGTAAMIDGMIARIEETLGQKATAVLTGGNSGLIAPLCRTKVVHDPNLLLDGLIRLYRKNVPAKV